MAAAAAGQRSADKLRPWGAQWGLQFESESSTTDTDALERSFWATRNSAHAATSAVLSAGVALVHGLLAFKLHSQDQDGLATAAAATMAQQVVVWMLAVLAPPLFIRLRPLLYAFSVTFPAVQASPLYTSLSVVSCDSRSGPAFWLSQLLSTGVPWLLVHAVLFPLTVSQGLLVHGVATALLVSSNRSRCAAALEQCPAAGPLLVKLAGALQRLSIFSATRGSWLDNGIPPALSQQEAGPAAAAAAAAVAPGLDLQHRSCIAVYSTLQISLGYLAVLQLAWWLERAARLAYLRRTEEVEAEWRLERKQRPPGTLALELGAMLLLAWQLVDLGLALLGMATGAGVAGLSAAGGSSVAAGGAAAGGSSVVGGASNAEL